MLCDPVRLSAPKMPPLIPMPARRCHSPIATGRRRALVVGVVGLLAAACGEVEEPYLGAEITVDSAVAGAEPVERIESDPADIQQLSEPSSVLPPRDPGYVPVLVVGSAAGIGAGDAASVDPLEPPLGQLGIRATSDDLFGGLVVETMQESVLWFAAEGAEADVIRETGARLLDVGYLGNTAEALVLSEERLIERIRLVDLQTEPIVVLADSDQLLSFSAAGGLYALALGDAQCGRLLFLNSAGDPVNIGGPAMLDCPVPQRPTFTLLDLSPDGDAMAYTEVTYRSDGVEASTQLVGVELSSSVELFRIPIGDIGDRVSSITFDGRRVAFVRTPLEGGEPEVVMVDAFDEGQLFETVATPGVEEPVTVSFARLPLKVGTEPAE